MNTRAIGYVRVSTQEQAREGVSLEAQRSKLAAYAELHDLDLVEVVSDEGISGKRTENRPGLLSALRRLRAGEVGALVVLKLDRLSRSTRDVLGLVERCDREGWSLHSISERLDTSTAAGRFVVTVLAALAQMEREQIGERTLLALEHVRSQGQKTGGAHCPYGYRLGPDGRSLLPDETEREVVEEIVQLKATGSSLSRIAHTLNEAGARTKAGRQWTHTQVSRALRAAHRFGAVPAT